MSTLAALALASLSLAAAADDRPIKAEDDRHTRSYWDKASARTYEAIDKFADCIVQYRFVDVKTLLEMSSDNPRVARLGKALATDSAGCMENAGLGLRTAVFRWALIEALYRRDVLKRGGAPSVALGADRGEIDAAKCVVGREPAKSEAILRTYAGSKQQDSAMRALGSVTAACGFDRPRNLPDQQVMRFQIAEALYRYRQNRAGGVQ